MKTYLIKKKVLITGAGRGLGRATAKAFMEAGFFVIATDIEKDVQSDFSNNEDVICYDLDVTSEQETAGLSNTIEKRFGHIDVLVSNAAVFDFYPVAEAGSGKLRKIFDVNVFALTNLTKYFLPLLIKSSGRIIVVSSESYKVPSPFQPYAISKQALESLYNAIKLELSITNVQCVLIRPGAMQTKILDDTLTFNPEKENSLFQKEFRKFIQTIPKYIAKVSDTKSVAELVLKAAMAKNPKAIYSINHNLLVSLLSFLPRGLKNFVIRKNLKT